MSSNEMSGGAAAFASGAPFRTMAIIASLAATLGLAACDGDNLFGGGRGVVTDPPVVTQLEAPAEIGEGQLLNLRVRAVAPRGLTGVTVNYTGAVTSERVFEIESTTDTVTLDFTLQIPAQVTNPVLTIEVVAEDQAGRESEPRRRTVNVLNTSGPAVTSTTTNTGASPGGTVNLRVQATDAEGLQAIGWVLLSPGGDTIAQHSVPATGTARDTTFTVAVPLAYQGEAVSVVGFAENAANLRGFSAPIVLQVSDSDAPQLTFLEPQEGGSYTVGAPIRVRLHVVDSASGIAEVRLRGVSFRNFPDTLSNSTPTVRYPEIVVPFPQGPDRAPPVDTVLVRDLIPTDDNTSEPVFLIARVSDQAGNTTVDTVQVVPGPRVTVLSPPGGTAARVNSTIQVRVRAVDPVSGIDSVRVSLNGVVQRDTVFRAFNGTRDPVDVSWNVGLGGQTGTVEITARAWNTERVAGFTPQPVVVIVSEQQTIDNDAPRVLRRIETTGRVELMDTIRVVVEADDGLGVGVQRYGISVLAVPVGTTDTMRFYRSSEPESPPVSNVGSTFSFTLAEQFTELNLAFPSEIQLLVHAYAVDGEGNRGCSTSTTMASLVCTDSVLAGGRMHYRTSTAPTPALVTTVSGRSIQMPGRGRIADAVVDVTNRRVYLSNIEANRVESFNLSTNTFGVHRRVGAAPWGMALSIGGDTLFVANSGGTNISRLPVTPAALGDEVVAARILTPNTLLTDAVFTVDDQGIRRLSRLDYYDFSDRPQFIAQDTSGRLVYSTVPTDAAGGGTIRYIAGSGASQSVRLMHRNLVVPDENRVAVEYLDSLRTVRGDAGDQFVMYSRNASNQVLSSAPSGSFSAAIEDLQSQGALITQRGGGWDIPAITLGDTTFVATSTDRAWIAFGEGQVAPFGRIFICCTRDGDGNLGLSDEKSVADLVGNASERVIGLGLNNNGSLGVARGVQATYYFTGQHGNLGAGQLRLQGEFTSGMAGGMGGATLHPSHDAVIEGTADHALSFVATAQRTIKIIHSHHFYERGEIPLRDNVAGPVRAFLPAAAENSGLLPDDPNYIVVKVLAVTEGDNVVVINVRRKDLKN